MDTVYIARARSMNINVCIDLAFVTKVDKFLSFVEIQLNSLCKTLIILALSGCTYCEMIESLKRKIKIHLRTIWFDTSLLIKFVLLTGSSFRICNFHVSNENV